MVFTLCYVVLTHRQYRPLVAHVSARTLRRCQASATTYLEVVAVQPHPAAHGTNSSGGTGGGGGGSAGRGRRQVSADALYCFVLKKQQQAGALCDCW